MQPDDMGGRYPHIDTDRCIDCGLCVRACSFAHSAAPLLPKECYAVVNKNEDLRSESSSGGVFIELARRTIAQRGVVFGAVFTENWSVVHTYAETMEEVFPMMGSKYLQSDTNHTFRQVKNFLENGRKVLYTGTPCQIAGLKRFLGKDYLGLLTVEVICHGVPLPGVWNTYLEETFPQSRISSIRFRDKRLGWRNFGIEFRLSSQRKEMNDSASSTLHPLFQTVWENPYMVAFLKNWSLRPSCHACKSKGGSSQADMTIGDFWGISETGMTGYDDKGVSCVICRTDKGRDAITEQEDLTLVAVDYNTIYQGNPSLEKSVDLSLSAYRFHKSFPRKGFYRTFNKIEHPGFFYRGIRLFYRKLQSLRIK